MLAHSSTSASPALDPAALNDLRSMGGDELVSEIVATFIDDAPRQLAALIEVIDLGAADRIARQAHGLKGAALAVGATRLAHVCLAIELDSRKGSLTEASARRNDLEPTIAEACRLLGAA